MENEQMNLLGSDTTEQQAADDRSDNYTPKERELIRQLVKSDLGKRTRSLLNLWMIMWFLRKCSSP